MKANPIAADLFEVDVRLYCLEIKEDILARFHFAIDSLRKNMADGNAIKEDFEKSIANMKISIMSFEEARKEIEGELERRLSIELNAVEEFRKLKIEGRMNKKKVIFDFDLGKTYLIDFVNGSSPYEAEIRASNFVIDLHGKEVTYKRKIADIITLCPPLFIED